MIDNKVGFTIHQHRRYKAPCNRDLVPGEPPCQLRHDFTKPFIYSVGLSFSPPIIFENSPAKFEIKANRVKNRIRVSSGQYTRKSGQVGCVETRRTSHRSKNIYRSQSYQYRQLPGDKTSPIA